MTEEQTHTRNETQASCPTCGEDSSITYAETVHFDGWLDEDGFFHKETEVMAETVYLMCENCGHLFE